MKKTKDYGTAWRVLRLPSITDQIFIKAQRIRSIQEKGKQLVEDDIRDEFVGIINYCVIALMQLSLPADADQTLPAEEVERQYTHHIEENIKLLTAKTTITAKPGAICVLAPSPTLS